MPCGFITASTLSSARSLLPTPGTGAFPKICRTRVNRVSTNILRLFVLRGETSFLASSPHRARVGSTPAAISGPASRAPEVASITQPLLHNHFISSNGSVTRENSQVVVPLRPKGFEEAGYWLVFAWGHSAAERGHPKGVQAHNPGERAGYGHNPLFFWCRREDSNFRPAHYESAVRTTRLPRYMRIWQVNSCSPGSCGVKEIS